MKKVLFLCTGNSCRSQMAEGWARHLHSDQVDAVSAGTERHGMNLWAVRAMAEEGVDLASHHSKKLEELSSLEFDLVVTVCDRAAETCPLFPGSGRVVHRGFADPPAVAHGLTDNDKILDCYRRVRDEIRDFVIDLPSLLEGQP